MAQINASAATRHSTHEGIGDVVTVRGRLALLGWASMRAWAHAHGYERQLVAWTVKTWGNRTDRRPHGGLTRQVMADLRVTFDQQKTPAMRQAEMAGDFARN